MAALLIEELSKSMELPEDVKHRITGWWMMLDTTLYLTRKGRNYDALQP